MTAVTTRAPGRSEPVERLAEEYSDSAPAYDRHWAPVLRPFAVRLLDQLRRFGPTGRRLATLSGRQRAACLSRLRRRTRRLSGEELVWRPEVLYGVGRLAEGGAS